MPREPRVSKSTIHYACHPFAWQHQKTFSQVLLEVLQWLHLRGHLKATCSMKSWLPLPWKKGTLVWPICSTGCVSSDPCKKPHCPLSCKLAANCQHCLSACCRPTTLLLVLIRPT